MNQKVIEVSMGMILKAGNARTKLQESIDKLLESNPNEANALLKEAHDLLKEAHILQTKVIQSEAKGEDFEFSLLFSHAQDTLMTIVSEHLLMESLFKLYSKIDERMSRLENYEQ